MQLQIQSATGRPKALEAMRKTHSAKNNKTNPFFHFFLLLTFEKIEAKTSGSGSLGLVAQTDNRLTNY